MANGNHMGIIADQTQCFKILFEGAVILFLFQTVSLPDCEKISVLERFYSNHNLAPIYANIAVDIFSFIINFHKSQKYIYQETITISLSIWQISGQFSLVHG